MIDDTDIVNKKKADDNKKIEINNDIDRGQVQQ